MDPNRLKSIPLFASLSDEGRREVSILAGELSVEEGRRLVTEGDYAYEFMAIEEGRAEVQRGGERIAELGPGDFFGETGLLEKHRRNATVVALSPMRLITLSGWDLKRLGRAAPEALEVIRAAIAERRPR